MLQGYAEASERLTRLQSVCLQVFTGKSIQPDGILSISREILKNTYFDRMGNRRYEKKAACRSGRTGGTERVRLKSAPVETRQEQMRKN